MRRGGELTDAGGAREGGQPAAEGEILCSLTMGLGCLGCLTGSIGWTGSAHCDDAGRAGAEVPGVAGRDAVGSFAVLEGVIWTTANITWTIRRRRIHR